MRVRIGELPARGTHSTLFRRVWPRALQRTQCRCCRIFASTFRLLARTPLTTAIALLSIALSIGATAVVFAAIKSVLIDPLPYSRPYGLRMTSGLFPMLGVSPMLGRNILPEEDRPGRPDVMIPSLLSQFTAESPLGVTYKLETRPWVRAVQVRKASSSAYAHHPSHSINVRCAHPPLPLRVALVPARS